jgi:glycosyltransferase involved in cell wall biosynthesis
VDHKFWRPCSAEPEELICSAGREQRDYPTLIEAMQGSTIPIVVAAASAWSTGMGVGTNAPLPPTMTVERLDYVRLRQLYARSRFVVVPLVDTDFQAGITTILEAMAMGKAVVVSDTRGQRDAGVVRHGENGLRVSPGQPGELRDAIDYLWKNPSEARRMGEAARRDVAEHFNVDEFAGQVAAVIRSLE